MAMTLVKMAHWSLIFGVFKLSEEKKGSKTMQKHRLPALTGHTMHLFRYY
jgi:hypothetical protein